MKNLSLNSEWLYTRRISLDGQESKKAFYKAIEIAKKNKTKIAITLSDHAGVQIDIDLIL